MKVRDSGGYSTKEAILEITDTFEVSQIKVNHTWFISCLINAF